MNKLTEIRVKYLNLDLGTEEIIHIDLEEKDLLSIEYFYTLEDKVKKYSPYPEYKKVSIERISIAK